MASRSGEDNPYGRDRRAGAGRGHCSGHNIVSIVGAQDYTEVTTLRGRHLVRLSLTELEARLDPASFVRVRRSAIINLRRLAKAEPAGAGRLLAHMITSELVPVSRSGAQSLKQLIV